VQESGSSPAPRRCVRVARSLHTTRREQPRGSPRTRREDEVDIVHAADAATREKLSLPDKPDGLHYVSQSGRDTIDGVDDKEEWAATVAAMENMQFPDGAGAKWVGLLDEEAEEKKWSTQPFPDYPVVRLLD